MITSSLPRRLALSAILLLLLAPESASAETGLTCQRVPELWRTFLQKHIDFHYLNDELRQRVVDSYVKQIDPSKTLFLRDEVSVLQANLRGLLQDVRDGNCGGLMAVQADLVKRYERMEVFVRGLLSNEAYAIDPSAILIIDPEKRGHPLTPEARDELLTRLVHFQMTNYLDSDMQLPEAKAKLIHRYELMTRRAREQNEARVYAAFLDAFATSLDPHSNYLSQDVLEDFQISMELSLEGIGVALSSRDGYSIVEKIIPGGAADHLKLLEPQDKIVAVAQEGEPPVDIVDMDLRDVVRMIRGKQGTQVHLTVLRQGEKTQRLNVSIVRDKIDLEEQAAKLRFENIDVAGKPVKLAVLELPSFYGGPGSDERQSSRDVADLLARVKEEKAAGLLLDLSRNGGGLLETSVDIAGLFIQEGGVVAVRNSFSKVQWLQDRDARVQYDGPMVVLTSRISASASEIVAGALKDYHRAVIAGDDHTFGKGTVQSMVQLPEDLGAIKVTTALFFRPGGMSTQHEGVASDVVMPSIFASEDFGEKHQPYSLPGQSIAPVLGEAGLQAASQGPEHPLWPAVTPEIVSELARRSASRVGASDDFKKIRERLAKNEERGGVVHLADLIKERAEETARNSNSNSNNNNNNNSSSSSSHSGAAKSDTAAGTEGAPGVDTDLADDQQPSVQQREAIQILADLVQLTS